MLTFVFTFILNLFQSGRLFSLTFSHLLQVESKYEAEAPAPYLNLVRLTLPNGLSIGGTASGGQALLVSVDGCGFVNPASLMGHVILFQANTDKQLLSTVTGNI